jgi:hypothetical protein
VLLEAHDRPTAEVVRLHLPGARSPPPSPMKTVVASILVLAAACASPATRPEPAAAPSGDSTVVAQPADPSAPAPRPAASAAPRCADRHASTLAAIDGAEAPALLELADCFRAEGAVGKAIQTWRALIRRFDRSPEAIVAMRRAGEAYAAIAHFVEAADVFEDYAQRYPKELDAEEKLVEATCFRHALGLEDDAIRDAGLLTRYFGRPKRTPEEICAGR